MKALNNVAKGKRAYWQRNWTDTKEHNPIWIVSGELPQILSYTEKKTRMTRRILVKGSISTQIRTEAALRIILLKVYANRGELRLN